MESFMETFMKNTVKQAVKVVIEDGEVLAEVVNGFNIWSLFEGERKPEMAATFATLKIWLQRRAEDGNAREKKFANAALLLFDCLLEKEKFGYDIALKEMKDNGLV